MENLKHQRWIFGRVQSFHFYCDIFRLLEISLGGFRDLFLVSF